MKLPVLFLLVLCVNLSVSAAETESAKLWLERFSQSLRQLNFSASFVVVKNNQAEPYHWFHGIDEAGQELEILTRLNGSRHDVLRQGELVSYLEPDQEPYSVISDDTRGPIPSVFRGDISELEESYRFISVGRSRILGRVAQLIRIVAKDKYRYSYWLWLDQNTGILLKMAVLTRQGKLLEQVQLTHLEVNDKLSDNLIQLKSTELPKAITLTNQQQNKQLTWQVDWLPRGFSMVKSNQHYLNSYNRGADRTVDFILFSDGLVDISVYVNLSNEKFRAAEYANDGATLVFNAISQGIEVGVVGEIPLDTAQKIAESIAPASALSRVSANQAPDDKTLKNEGLSSRKSPTNELKND
ncbi:MucB/RseB C-terminal domain-containing protein [Colwellia sp. E2M01]|uniref:MucB/RseB C-terminal domain-containing protein n=1 Tax=Colwellia sp. E2M01 TaxID=2841561 RepID=UPI001C0826AB|nr:MucB/RseB C-terminal domain-containing protein [Colwellia sp. E2M01]MBU2869616.1 MucB/RseB C-terminal domain-containing protein [Colwellia sp. E2M01]